MAGSYQIWLLNVKLILPGLHFVSPSSMLLIFLLLLLIVWSPFFWSYDTLKHAMTRSDISCRMWTFLSIVSPLIIFYSGNLPLYTITRQGHYELRVDLEDWEGKNAFANYRYFRIDAPEKLYRIIVVGYFGNAGTNISTRPCVKLNVRLFGRFCD